MATNNPRGFVPFRTLNGNPIGNSRHYPVSSNNPTSMFPGDPVVLNNGYVRVIDASGISAGEPPVLGVVAAVYDSNDRPLTHSLPSGGQFLNASTAGYVDVVTDPDATYLVSTDATAAQSMVGQFVRASAAAANSAAGISGFIVTLAQATNTSVAHQFTIIGVGPNEIATGGIGDNAFALNQDMEVMINDSIFRRKSTLAGTVSAGAT